MLVSRQLADNWRVWRETSEKTSDGLLSDV